MKKLVCLMMSILMLFTCVSCLAESRLDMIKNQGVLVVGVEATFPPFESYDPETGTEIIGFDIDVCQAIADYLGVALEVKDMEFGGIVSSVSSGKIDIAPCITKTEERAQIVAFSEEYTGSKLGVVIREGDDTISTLADLKSHAISAQLGSLAETRLLACGVTNKSFNKHDEALLAVLNGVTDGHVLDGTVAMNYVSSMGGLKVIEVPELNEGVAGLSIIAAMGEDELVAEINACVAEMEASGAMDELRAKWNLFN